MQYVSTRDSSCKVSAAQAIVSGLSKDGGLFLPETLPSFSIAEIQEMCKTDYIGRAVRVLSKFLTDFSREELQDFISKAYARKKFPPAAVAPVVSLNPENAYILELFHGPTCAFKDFALQLLPYLLTASLKKIGEEKTVVILVATSGDTGKAALEGFADVEGTKICVFYPDGGTSNVQRLQMTTQMGENVMVFAAHGNFDDAQTGVKQIFTDAELAQTLSQQGFLLSSANSINWGRLVPQIAYYFSAYCDLINRGKIRPGAKINVVVPTGNFGNILAAYLAGECGLPLEKLICASNQNKVLTDFIQTGVYDRNRPFHVTTSPSMDILISSNLERLLYLLAGRSDAHIRDWMQQLSETGRYQIEGSAHDRLKEKFYAGHANDRETAFEIRNTLEKNSYLSDPHTAVAIKVWREYVQQTGDRTPTVIASTASPFKFASTVLPAAYRKQGEGTDFEQLRQLAAASGFPAPASLTALQHMTERFQEVVEPQEMKQAVGRWLHAEV